MNTSKNSLLLPLSLSESPWLVLNQLLCHCTPFFNYTSFRLVYRFKKAVERADESEGPKPTRNEIPTGMLTRKGGEYALWLVSWSLMS